MRPVAVAPLMLLLLSASVDSASAQVPARVETPYTLIDAESRTYIEGGGETPLRGNGPLTGYGYFFYTRPHYTDSRFEMANTHSRIHSFVRQHSLSIASAGILILWICLYSVSSPSTHIGSFFGNAIADWSGVVVMVFATKYLYEKGSAESRRPPQNLLSPVRQRLRDHSLSLFLIVTGIGWIALFVSMDSEAKWGQVVGNIVSEWTQIFGLVLLTKRLIERHSKESAR